MRFIRNFERISFRRVVTAEARIQGTKLGIEACFSYYQVLLLIFGDRVEKTGAVPLTFCHHRMTPL